MTRAPGVCLSAPCYSYVDIDKLFMQLWVSKYFTVFGYLSIMGICSNFRFEMFLIWRLRLRPLHNQVERILRSRDVDMMLANQYHWNKN